VAYSGEHIWIIGASSGIGKALAEYLAAQGARLTLSARNAEALHALAETLPGDHQVLPLDVSDILQVEAAVQHLGNSNKPLHRTLFLAAVFRPRHINALDMQFTKELIEVNLLGAIYVAHALLPLYRAQKSGQLVMCGSIAGFTGLPGGQPYSATKAALINFTESLYAEVEDYIDVKLINPGFVRTRMTDKNDFPMPMRLEPDVAAKHIARGLLQSGFEIHFPKAFTCSVKFLRFLPYPMALFITRRLREHA